jgi:adenylate cyclase
MGWGCRECGGDNPEGTRFCGHCGRPAASPAAGPGEAPEVVEEHRLVTALFADISGFTALADSLGTEELHRIISPVIGLLASVAERYEGTIAKYAGDALLVFFGAPVAQEDHAARALRVAGEMHAQLAAALPDLPPEAQSLELHIGVNTGHVVAGMFGGDVRQDYSILGDAVNLAQRLESVAPPGETYVGETTWRLTSERFELESVGELTLKGKSRAMAAWRLVGERAAADGAGRRARGVPFVGRDEELAAITAVLRGQLDGHGGVVGLAGEPGVGKSRLTQAVREWADDRGVLWLEARCISYGSGVAYWPFVDLLRRSFGIRIEQDPAEAGRYLASALAITGVGQVAPYFARLLGLPPPPGGPDLADLSPEAFRRGLHEALATWLAALGKVGPVVLAIEDVHWADTATIDVTGRLVRLCDDGPVVLYLTGRPEGAGVIEDLAGGVATDRRATIDVAPLGPGATAGLVAAVLGGPPGPALLETVAERAAGNPFFVLEMVRSLLDAGAVVAGEDGWALAPGWDVHALPPTIEGVLSARIDMLPRAAATALQLASVVGRRLNLALLEALADEVADLRGALDRLVEAGFLDRVVTEGEEVLQFHHALVVEVAYSRLLRRQRRELHRRVAEAAEELYGTGDDVIDLLARHFWLAEAGAKAVDYLVQAGERSKRLFANEEAVLHLSRAAQLARENDRLARRLPGLLLELADVEDLTGDLDEAGRLYAEVQALSDDVAAWRGLASLARRRGECARALELIDAAFATEALTGADLTPLWLERAWVMVSEGRFLDAIETALAGLAASSAADGPDAGQLLVQLTRAECFIGRLDSALVHGERARQLFERAGDLRGLTAALRVLGTVHTEIGNLGEAARVLLEAMSLAERTGSIEEVCACLVNLGQVELQRGDLERAMAYDRRALEESTRIGHVIGQMLANINLAEKLLRADRLDEALACVDRGLALASSIGSSWTIADAHRTLAGIRLRQGLPAEAAARAQEAASLFEEIGDAANAAGALDLAADAFDGAGDAERARGARARARSLVDG